MLYVRVLPLDKIKSFSWIYHCDQIAKYAMNEWLNTDVTSNSSSIKTGAGGGGERKIEATDSVFRKSHHN